MEYFIGCVLVVLVIQLYRIENCIDRVCRNQVKQAEQIGILFERMNKK